MISSGILTCNIASSASAIQASQPNPFGGGGTPFTAALLVSFEADPISFTYEGGIASTAGDPVAPTKTGTTAHSATVDVSAGATDAHVMVVNR